MVRYTRSAAVYLLLAVLFFSYIPFKAHATPQTHPNTYVNTGDQRSDIIGVALTQVGYYEGANNDTKYGVWYGYNNLGWCGIFVAWCADQAGVPTSVLAKTGVPNPASYGLTAKPDGYVPKPGDLFFSRDYSHVGLVYYVDGEYFYSLEGNTWENGPEGVYIRRHKRSAVLFASPAYQGGADHNYVMGIESEHPHKVYYRCADCGDRYYSGENSQHSDCITCVQNTCSHSFNGWEKVSDAQHGRTCVKCNKAERVSHKWGRDTVIKAATCSEAGVKEQSCSSCGAVRSVTIPKTGVHSYNDWVSSGEENHSRSCRVCGLKEQKKHDLSDWETDGEKHWKSCKTCGVKTVTGVHDFSTDCNAPCQSCGFMRPEGHRYLEQWTTDELSHWNACALCGLAKDQGAHTFSADCDEGCEICGYSRVTQHSMENGWRTDDAEHWHECSVCGSKEDVQAHTPEEASRSGAIQHCTVCALVLTKESEHTHAYDMVQSDQTGHWGVCGCGLEMEHSSHQWSVNTQMCAICDYTMSLPKADYSGLLPWIAIAGGILIVAIAGFTLLLRKRK